jgi:RNA polymerase sigma-70 factor (ECF subfamily)
VDDAAAPDPAPDPATASGGRPAEPRVSAERLAADERQEADRGLLTRLRAGDEAAFDAIFRGRYAVLVGVAERMLRDRAVAEELAQEVLLALWRRRDSVAPDEALGPYLVRAVRNRALNHLRHLHIERRDAVHAAGPTEAEARGAGPVVAEELARALERAVGELPPRCREVFTLSRAGGLSYAEIAERLGISVKTVEAQMGRALRALRVELAPWLER